MVFDDGLIIGTYLFEVCVLFILGVIYLSFGLSDIVYVSIFSLSSLITNTIAANQICPAGVPWTSQIISSLLPLFGYSSII